MSQSNKADRVVILVFLVFLGAVPLLDWGCHVFSGYLPGRPPFENQKLGLSLGSALSGTLGTRLERAWMNHSVVMRGTVGPYNETVYRFTRRLPSAVRVGENKWLFRDADGNEFSRAESDRLIKTNVNFLKEIRKALKKKDAELIVALVPDRPRMYPENYYRDDKMPPNRRDYLPRLVKALNQNGVESYDLSEPLSELKTRGVAVSNSDDHHWNAQGARAAGEFLGGRLREKLRGSPLKKSPYRVRWMKRKSNASFLNKLGFVPASRLERSFHARETFPTFKHQKPKGKLRHSAAYWSTSFAQYGSPQFFANSVQRPILSLQANGRGSSWGIKAGGLDRIPKARKGEPPFLVVWEIPEYHTVAAPTQLPDYINSARANMGSAKRKPHKTKRKPHKTKRKPHKAKRKPHKANGKTQ